MIVLSLFKILFIVVDLIKSKNFLATKSIMKSMSSYEQLANTFANAAAGRSFAKAPKFDLFKTREPKSDESSVNV